MVFYIIIIIIIAHICRILLLLRVCHTHLWQIVLARRSSPKFFIMCVRISYIFMSDVLKQKTRIFTTHFSHFYFHTNMRPNKNIKYIYYLFEHTCARALRVYILEVFRTACEQKKKPRRLYAHVKHNGAR